MPLVLLTLTIEDAGGDKSPVSVYVDAINTETIASLSDEFALIFWDVVRPLITGVLVAVSVSFKPDFSAWTNNSFAVLSDVEEKAVFTIRICGGERPIRMTLPTVKESIFSGSGANRFVDEANSDYIEFAHVLEENTGDGGINAADSHGERVCEVLFGEQQFGKG